MSGNMAFHPDLSCLTLRQHLNSENIFTNFEHYSSTLKIEGDEKFSKRQSNQQTKGWAGFQMTWNLCTYNMQNKGHADANTCLLTKSIKGYKFVKKTCKDMALGQIAALVMANN